MNTTGDNNAYSNGGGEGALWQHSAISMIQMRIYKTEVHFILSREVRDAIFYVKYAVYSVLYM